MRSGPPPHPTALKVLRGNPGKRALNKDEPQPTGKAKCPEWLGAYGRQHWDEVAPMLERMGVLTDADANALGDMCLAYQKWMEAVDLEREHGTYVKAQSGFPVTAPWVAAGERQREIWRKIQQEFGMTPAARSRVTAAKPAETESPLKALMAMRNRK